MSLEAFNRILIPNIPQQVQNNIQNKINKMYLLKFQSKALLEIAKKAVEIAIEQNEERAINYTNQEVKAVGLKEQNEDVKECV